MNTNECGETARTVRLADGSDMPLLGMGTWHMGEDKSREQTEISALREGLAQGVRLIDTAELYGDGDTERLVGMALQGVPRDSVYVVSKVMPSHAGYDHMRDSCKASLARLGLDYLDLYLLHWPGSVPLHETVECMEALRSEGLIRRWGVSNFDVDDMQRLWDTSGGDACVVNQVLYHLDSRGVEVELQPWMRRPGVTMMAYCPLAQGGRLASGLMNEPTLNAVAKRHNATPAQILLAWVMRDGKTVAIPKASTPEHARQNAEAARIVLTAEDLDALNAQFPAPRSKPPLDWL